MHVGAVIAVTDLDRAREFYEGKLGLAGAATPGGWLVRGVGFLGPDDLPFTLDADGISADTSGLHVAWLRDPDGSVLTIFTAPE